MNNRALSLALISLLAVATGPGCSTNTQGDTSAPVYLTVDTEELASVQNIPALNQDALRIPTVVLRNRLKNPAAGSSGFLDIKMDDYVVQWSRLDGGTKVPQTETFAASFLVPAGGVSTLSTYTFMTVGGWFRSPLDQLYPFNGGIDRETGRSDIHAKMTVTFRGHTLAGQAVTGQSDFDIKFVYVTSNAISALPSGN